MKKAALLAVLGVAILFAVTGRAQDKKFTGQIMDSQCAFLGGHAAMMNKDMDTEKKCTLECVKQGGMFVLYDPAGKKSYQLDDQKKPEAFAGDNVVVTGTLDESSGTIKVANIEAAK